MLPKKLRLSGREIKKTLKEKPVERGEYFNLRYLLNNKKISRFGVIISHLVLKKAVERNHLKRQILEIIAASLSKIKTGYDIIIVPLKSVEKLKFHQLNLLLLEQLKINNLLNE